MAQRAHVWRTSRVKGKTYTYCERCGLDKGEPGTDQPCKPTRL